MSVSTIPASDVQSLVNASAQQDLSQSRHWSWQKVTARPVTTIEELAKLLHLDITALASLTSVNEFSLRIPLTLVQRMQRGKIDDPVLLQVLNRREEQNQLPGYSEDPLLEHQNNPCPGIIHKYTSRVLLTAATSCPLNCRYCFRRHFAYQDNRLSPSTWKPALDYIDADPDIKEVILSGGEPLMLKDDVLKKLLDELQAISHVKLLRIHTRFPIAVPQRVTPSLLHLIGNTSIPLTIVTHCNHAQELDEPVVSALKELKQSGVGLLNQTVILKNINDDVETLEALSYALYEAGILPYYLHCQDPVSGTSHFDVGDVKSKRLANALISRLPGYLVPTLVREIPDRPAKTRL